MTAPLTLSARAGAPDIAAIPHVEVHDDDASIMTKVRSQKKFRVGRTNNVPPEEMVGRAPRALPCSYRLDVNLLPARRLIGGFSTKVPVQNEVRFFCALALLRRILYTTCPVPFLCMLQGGLLLDELDESRSGCHMIILL